MPVDLSAAWYRGVAAGSELVRMRERSVKIMQEAEDRQQAQQVAIQFQAGTQQAFAESQRLRTELEDWIDPNRIGEESFQEELMVRQRHLMLATQRDTMSALNFAFGLRSQYAGNPFVGQFIDPYVTNLMGVYKTAMESTTRMDTATQSRLQSREERYSVEKVMGMQAESAERARMAKRAGVGDGTGIEDLKDLAELVTAIDDMEDGPEKTQLMGMLSELLSGKERGDDPKKKKETHPMEPEDRARTEDLKSRLQNLQKRRSEVVDQLGEIGQTGWTGEPTSGDPTMGLSVHASPEEVEQRKQRIASLNEEHKELSRTIKITMDELQDITDRYKKAADERKKMAAKAIIDQAKLEAGLVEHGEEPPSRPAPTPTPRPLPTPDMSKFNG